MVAIYEVDKNDIKNGQQYDKACTVQLKVVLTDADFNQYKETTTH